MFIPLSLDLMKCFLFYYPHNNVDKVVLKTQNPFNVQLVKNFLSKRKSRRSSVRTVHKVETSSMQSLFNKLEPHH